jgi:hypothetical protein
MPRLNRTDAQTVEEYGFTFSAPPERTSTRKGKHHETFMAARSLCEKFPGQSLRVLSFENPSQAYSLAKQINNGDRSEFKDDSADWTAKSAKYVGDEGEDLYGLWLTYSAVSEE